MIIADKLSKKFDDFIAVDEVNLHVSAGEVMILLGPNGAGKTTTVRMLTSILAPSSGQASVAGFDVIKEADKVRSSVGVLTEHHGLYGRMNAQEYLLFYGELYGLDKKTCLQRIDELLGRFGLLDVKKKRLGEYSKGMRQKLALVRALIHNPPVLLLDEPTSAMDPESSRLVRDAIHSLRDKKRAVLLCTHNLAEADELADRVAIIRNGKIILNDTTSNIKLQMLGPAEFEARLANTIGGWSTELPPGIELCSQGDNWLRFQVKDPEKNNPILINRLVENHLDLVSFQEVPRTLEQAYLAATHQAVSQEEAMVHV